MPSYFIKNTFFTCIFIVVAMFNLQSCDPMACRDCDEFNSDISSWRPELLLEEDEIIFVGEDSVEYLMKLDSLFRSPVFNECQIAETPDEVYCLTYLEYFYSMENLDLVIKEYFLNNERGMNSTISLVYSFKKETDKDFLRILGYIYFAELEHSFGLENLDKIEMNGISYKEVLRYKIDRMTNERTGAVASSKLVNELIFKEGIGIVYFKDEKENGYIRKK